MKTKSFGDRHVVGTENDSGSVPLQIQHRVPQAIGIDRIQARKRLVED
jgi:hypothetical protein